MSRDDSTRNRAIAPRPRGDLVARSSDLAKRSLDLVKDDGDIESLIRRAEMGDAEAQYTLGLLYGDENSKHYDFCKALGWWNRAADQGFVEAQFFLGCAHCMDYRFQEDYAIAAEWFNRAADQGHSGALINLGNMYASGNGLPRNTEMAVEFYRKAAARGDKTANTILNDIDLNGPNVQDELASHFVISPHIILAVKSYRPALENDSVPVDDTVPSEIREMKSLISTGRARGYVTVEELNDALPADMVSSDQLDSVLSIFDDMGIRVVENEDDFKSC